jgi:hypothetical protein
VKYCVSTSHRTLKNIVIADISNDDVYRVPEVSGKALGVPRQDTYGCPVGNQLTH